MSVQSRLTRRAMDLIWSSRTHFMGLLLLLVPLTTSSALDSSSCNSFGFACINETHFNLCFETISEAIECPAATRCDEKSPAFCVDVSEITQDVFLISDIEKLHNLQKSICETEIQTNNFIEVLQNIHTDHSLSTNVTQKFAEFLQNMKINIFGLANQTQILIDIFENYHRNSSPSNSLTDEIPEFSQIFNKNNSQTTNFTQKGAEYLNKLKENDSRSENRSVNLANFLNDLKRNVSQTTNFTNSLADLVQKLLIGISSQNETWTLRDILQRFNIYAPGLANEIYTRIVPQNYFGNASGKTSENTLRNNKPNEPIDVLPRTEIPKFPELSLDDYLPADFPDLIKHLEGILPPLEELSSLPKISPDYSIKPTQNSKLPNALQVKQINDILPSQKNSEIPQNEVLSPSANLPSTSIIIAKEPIHPDVQNSNLHVSSQSPNANIKPSGQSPNELLSVVQRVSRFGRIDSTTETSKEFGFTTGSTTIPEDPSTNKPDVQAEFVCIKPGKFAAPTNCKEYHVCVRNGESFTHSVGSCWRGFQFSSRWDECVPFFLSGCSRTEN